MTQIWNSYEEVYIKIPTNKNGVCVCVCVCVYEETGKYTPWLREKLVNRNRSVFDLDVTISKDVKKYKCILRQLNIHT